MKLFYMILFCIVCHSAGTLAIGIDSTICNSGIPFTQEVVVEEKGNVLVVANEGMEIIFILAFDWNRDGIYESLLFDINANGAIDLQLEGGQATAEQVIQLYCMYQQLKMS